MQLVLDDYVSGVLDDNGNGRLSIGPVRARQVWNITAATVSSESSLDTTAIIYSPSMVNLGGTYSGNQDTTDLNQTLRFGSRITAVWSGGTPNTVIVLSVSGTIELS